jgi:hypothetical protein
MFKHVRAMIAESEGTGMAHDQITEAQAAERGLVAGAVCLGDECEGAASWWSEEARVFWLAPAAPRGAPSCWRPGT